MASQLSVADLLAIVQPWSEIEEPIHRRLAQISDAEGGEETLWVGCGSGRSVLWWCERFRTHTEGTDPDPVAIDLAERTARDAGLANLATFQVADPTNLPHEDEVFDATIVHMLHLPGADAQSVLREARRVTRPMGTVMALVPSWLRTPTDIETARVDSLGIAALLTVEWKGLLRNAGVVEISVEEARPDGSWLAHRVPTLIMRGWRVAGWLGVRTVLGRNMRTLRRSVRNRSLSLFVMKGSTWPHN